MYEIRYHKLVKKDFLKLSKRDKKKIYLDIQRKLKTKPKEFGKPLQKELMGYYRLRVMHYRLIYKIEEDKVIVFIVHIGQRKDFSAYIKAAKRIQY